MRSSGGVWYVGRVQSSPPVPLSLGRRSGSSVGMVALGSSQAPCRRHWELCAGAALSGDGKHTVVKGMGREGALLSVGFLPL